MKYKKSKVFSNGTEYECFLEDYCEQCYFRRLGEDGFAEFAENGGCVIRDKLETSRFNPEGYPSSYIREIHDDKGNIQNWHHCMFFVAVWRD